MLPRIVEATDIVESHLDLNILLPENQKYSTFPTNHLITNESLIEIPPLDLVPPLDLEAPQELIPRLDLDLINAANSEREQTFSRKKRFNESNLQEKLNVSLKFKNSISNVKANSKTPSKAAPKSMKTRNFVMNAMKKIKKKKFFNNFANLGALHFRLINDQAIFYKDRGGKLGVRKGDHTAQRFRFLLFMDSIFKAGQRVLKKFLDVLPVFSPLLWPKICWDFIVSVLTIIQIFTFTLELAFFVDLQNRNFVILLTLVFYLDNLASLNTIIFKNGLLIKNRRLIFRNLIQTRTLTDLIPTMFLTIIAISNIRNLIYLNIILLVRIGKMRENVIQIKEQIIKNESALMTFRLITLVIKIFIFGHAIACCWHFVGYLFKEYYSSSPNWLKNKGIADEVWSIRYLYSIYWAITTMLSVGYGDIIPSNEFEIVFNIWAMFVGCCIFGYSVSIITSIFEQANRNEAILNDRMAKVSSMLREKNLPRETQTKVKKYLGFVWKQEQKDDPEYEELMMSKLSSNLRDEIYLHTNVKYLQRVPAFKSFSGKTLLCLSRAMKKVRFCPEEYVYREGDHDDLGIYFVLEGDLQMVTERDGIRTKQINTVWKTLKKEEFFGQNETFTGASRSFSVISSQFSTLFFLKRSDLIYILKKFQKDYEKFCLIRDMEIVYNDFNSYGVKCDSCGFSDHILKNCPLIKYIPDKGPVIGKHLKKRRDKAKNFKRRVRTTQNALSGKLNNSKMATEFLNVYADDDDLLYLLDFYAFPNTKQLGSDEKLEEHLLPPQKSRGGEDDQDMNGNFMKDDYLGSSSLKSIVLRLPQLKRKKTYIKNPSPQKEIKVQAAERNPRKKVSYYRQSYSLNSPKRGGMFTNRASDQRQELEFFSDVDLHHEHDSFKEGRGHEREEFLKYETADTLEKYHESEINISKFEFDRVKSFDNYFPGKNIEQFMFKLNTNV